MSFNLIIFKDADGELAIEHHHSNTDAFPEKIVIAGHVEGDQVVDLSARAHGLYASVIAPRTRSLMNEPIYVWVTEWDNRWPTVHRSKDSVLAILKNDGLGPEDIEQSYDTIFVDDWAHSHRVGLED